MGVITLCAEVYPVQGKDEVFFVNSGRLNNPAFTRYLKQQQEDGLLVYQGMAQANHFRKDLGISLREFQDTHFLRDRLRGSSKFTVLGDAHVFSLFLGLADRLLISYCQKAVDQNLVANRNHLLPSLAYGQHHCPWFVPQKVEALSLDLAVTMEYHRNKGSKWYYFD